MKTKDEMFADINLNCKFLDYIGESVSAYSKVETNPLGNIEFVYYVVFFEGRYDDYLKKIVEFRNGDIKEIC